MEHIFILIASAILLFVAGIAKGIQDTLLFHFAESPFAKKNPLFWDPNRSWQNKYKDYMGGDERPRFWGAKTFLVFLTDGWHLFGTINLTCIQAAVALPAVAALGVPMWWTLPGVVALKLVFGAGFRIYYKFK